MAAKLKIKKGDRVVVLTGKDKGKSGDVVAVMPKENRAVVSGVNVARRHQRQTAGQEDVARNGRRVLVGGGDGVGEAGADALDLGAARADQGQVEALVNASLGEYLEEHPREAKAIVSKCIGAAQSQSALANDRDEVQGFDFTFRGIHPHRHRPGRPRRSTTWCTVSTGRGT